MRTQHLNTTAEILKQIDMIRGMIKRLDTNSFQGQQREFELTQLICIYKTDLENILREVVMLPENRQSTLKAA